MATRTAPLVLVVDEPPIRAFLARWLSAAEYETIEAPDAETAVALPDGAWTSKQPATHTSPNSLGCIAPKTPYRTRWLANLRKRKARRRPRPSEPR